MWIALTGATLILAACTTGDPAAPADPTPSPPAATSTPAPTTITTSPSPTSALSDEEAAKQAILAYYAALNAALHSRQTAGLRSTFKAGCLVCEQDADTIDKARQAGRTFEGGEVTVTRVRGTQRSSTKLLAMATVARSRMIVRDATGHAIVDEPAGSIEKVFTLSGAGNGWLVEGITQP